MNIIVTGASRGIGYQLARNFASDNNNSVLLISRNEQRLKDLQQQCQDEFPQCRISIIPFDLEDLDGIEKSLNEKIRKIFSSVDVLVNNAGLLINKPINEIDVDDARRMMTVNYLAPLILVRSIMPLLINGVAPHVVNIGSMAGVPGVKKFPGLSGYSASKAAVHVLTECFVSEFGESGVHFNTLALGTVQTDMLTVAFPGLEAPLKADEMAGFVADFSLNGQKFFNGKILPVSLSTP
ncbi:MAG TPA: SDR family oxidoreductase [Bacteroides sp.]|nr:SDR family oxidoreductase [Bacteroides sp.]